MLLEWIAARRLARNDVADIVCQAAIACGGSPFVIANARPLSLRTQSVEAIHALEWIATLAGSLAVTLPI